MWSILPTCCAGPEELDSVALQMSTEGASSTSERASQYSFHVMNVVENTRSPLSAFGVCHMDDWLASTSKLWESTNAGKSTPAFIQNSISPYISPISHQGSSVGIFTLWKHDGLYPGEDFANLFWLCNRYYTIVLSHMSQLRKKLMRNFHLPGCADVCQFSSR